MATPGQLRATRLRAAEDHAPTRHPRASGRARRGRLAVGLLAIGIIAASAAFAPGFQRAGAAVPPQEPGVTLRVFDVQVPLDKLCTIRAGQSPNVDKVMPTVNWSTAADFGLENYFVANVVGNVNITTAGSYTFRLTSDDGSRLFIDGATVIDHDGIHAATAKEGTVSLATGYHALRIEQFERDGGQQITLEWRVPGSTAFTLVPNSALSTDAGAARTTTPGRKYCETGASATYEAEAAALSGGATVMTDHCCYSGSGFVAGYGSVGATTTFTVTAGSAGAYDIGLRYSNGPNPFTGTKTVSVYVNGAKIRQTSLASTTNWETWATRTETLNLGAGTNTIAYRYDQGDTGWVNLDFITVAAAQPGANLALNKPATSDSACAPTETAVKAVNGSVSGGLGDKWCSSGSSKWLQVDLGGAYSIGRFVVQHAAAGGESAALNTRDFTIQTSVDGAAWTGAVTVTGNTAATTTHDILATSARYVRLNVTTPSSNGDTLARIYEFEVYAADGASSRVTLFDGTSLAAWQHADGSAATWLLTGGAMEVRNGDIYTRRAFGDFKLHVEFWLPQYPPDVTGQARANSGVYLQARYEIQVLDSYGDTTPANDEAAAIYGKKAADRNAATAPQTWQTYDITFRAARYNSAGTKTANAQVTVVWNGVTVHTNVPIDGPTTLGAPEGPSAGPIRLQDHGNPVRYRNVWIEAAA